MPPFCTQRLQATDAEVTGDPTETYLAYLGANLRRERARKGMTQEALAEAAEMDVRFLQRIEGGHLNLRFRSFIRLATALGVRPGALLRRTAVPAPKVGRPRLQRSRSRR